MEPISVTSKERSTTTAAYYKVENFKFTGSGSEYFGIWIVNILLTIVTLGIYSAWAKVRNKQYFYGNTLLDDSSFEYTADPIRILKGRVIAVILLITYQLIASFMPSIGLIIALVIFAFTPWIIIKSLAFNARYSEYRNIRFGFKQNYADAAKVFIGIPLIMLLPMVLFGFAAAFFDTTSINPNDPPLYLIVTFFCVFTISVLIFPYFIYRSKGYVAHNHKFGTTDFELQLTNPKPVYSIYFKAFAFIVLSVIILAVISFIFVQGTTDYSQAAMIPIIVPIQLFFIVLYQFLFAYISSHIYNLFYQNTQIGKHRLMADMRTGGLAWIYLSNTIAIILTLGLFIPWAKVRSARYRANHTHLNVDGDLHDFIGRQESEKSALGEEIGEVFDIDITI